MAETQKDWKVQVEYNCTDCPYRIFPHGDYPVCAFLYDKNIYEDECRVEICPIKIQFIKKSD